jgi:uncharacterized protein
MAAVTSYLKESIDKIYLELYEKNEKLADMFKNCFLNTLETTTEILKDDTTFVFTGDIPAMWLRDSAAQVRHYLDFAKEDAELQRIIEGLINRQMMYVAIDPYANAFNKEPNNRGHKDDITEHNPWVWERKYEIDSLCYPIQLSYLYWKATGRTVIFDEAFKVSSKVILKQWKAEQRHENSPYNFIRITTKETETLWNDGKGAPVNYTGMTWSGFRPSDDACTFGYLIPSNMFAAVALGYLEEIAAEVYKDSEFAAESAQLKREIQYGINKYGIYNHPKYGKIYAYETDGFGNYTLMDDANVPSLLSLPYLGYISADDPVYINTRNFILSEDNPYFFKGKCAQGIGSPHTMKGYVWHIALIMQALTSNNKEEILDIISTLQNTDAGTGFMHEGFNADDHYEFTRPWFAWANSLFGELILSKKDLL